MKSPIIVAIDTSDIKQAETWFDKLDPRLCRVKIGKELFTTAGPSVVKMAMDRGFDVFLDLKFHDIPNTVAKAVRAAADMGVWMVNVHALGGPRMMRAAREAIDTAQSSTLLIAVTILTSHDENDLAAIGLLGDVAIHVKRLAQLACDEGLAGVVCSAHEAKMIKTISPTWLAVTPGIRLSSSTSDDQRRIMTPYDATTAGSDYLVIGRPITQAPDPIAVMQGVFDELGLNR